MKNKSFLMITTSFVAFGAILTGSLYYMSQALWEQSPEVESSFPVVNQDTSNFYAQTNASILSFDLGEMTLEDESNMIQIPLKGSLVVPQDEGDHPIVFIVPDLNSAADVSIGYDTLLGKMGETNCLGIRLDLASFNQIDGFDEAMLPLVFDEYRHRLSQALAGESLDFGVELMNKGSLSKVVLIGHGESSVDLYQIALDQEYKQQLNLAGILLIDPSKAEYNDLAFPDVPTAIMLSRYNEKDNLIGQDLYADYRQEKARKSMTSLVYVKDGKFDDFNIGDELVDSSFNFERNIEFVGQYVVDFLQSIFDTAPIGSGFTILEGTPKNLYGAEVRTCLAVPNTMMLINAALEPNPMINTLGGQVVANELDIKISEDELASFLLDWHSVNASLAIEIPAGNRDLSHYDAISIYLSNELSDEIVSDEVIQNQVGLQSFTIELIDEQNQTSRAVINSIDELVMMGTNERLLYNERIVLNQFKEVDLSQIKQINFLFNQTSQGRLRLADLSFVKTPIK